MHYSGGCTCANKPQNMGALPRLINEADLLNAVLAGNLLLLMIAKTPPPWLRLTVTLATGVTLAGSLARAFSPIGTALQGPGS